MTQKQTADYEYVASDKWHERHNNQRDTPRISIWMPTSAPFARLQTHDHGCSEPPTLPFGPPVAYVEISGISIGGYLEDLELLFESVGEHLRAVRRQCDEMTAERDAWVCAKCGEQAKDHLDRSSSTPRCNVQTWQTFMRADHPQSGS